MKNFFLFLAMLGSLSSFAQNSKQSNPAKYYAFKNKAELQIIDSFYQEALKNYKLAFENKYPNVRDLYNAFIVAYLVKDSISAKSYMDTMVIQGQLKDKFEKGRFGEIIKEEPLYNWLMQDYVAMHELSTKRPQKVLAEAYNKILEKDQQMRIGMTAPTQAQIKQLIAMDSNNVREALVLINSYGFPSYQKVGLHENVTEGYAGSPNTMWLLMWHTRGANHTLNEPVKKAVLEGTFPPDDYAIIIDMQNKTSHYFEVLPRKKDSEGRFIFEELLDESQINERRATIFLEPISEFKRKMEYVQNVDKRFYLIPVWAGLLNYAPMDFRTWNEGN